MAEKKKKSNISKGMEEDRTKLPEQEVPVEKPEKGGVHTESDRTKGLKYGGKVGKGYHKMPDGKIMKDSAHKNKMAHGGKVGRGCGAAIKGGGRVMKYGKSGC